MRNKGTRRTGVCTSTKRHNLTFHIRQFTFTLVFFDDAADDCVLISLVTTSQRHVLQP